jgi:hypothetical protein
MTWFDKEDEFHVGEYNDFAELMKAGKKAKAEGGWGFTCMNPKGITIYPSASF